MESGAGFCPLWNTALWSWLLISTSFLVIAKAEITCRSCQPPAAKPRSEELLWLMKTDTAETGTGFKSEIRKYPDGTAGSHLVGYKTQLLDCVAETFSCVLGRGRNIRAFHRKSTGQQHFTKPTLHGLPKNKDHNKATAAVGEKVSNLRQFEQKKLAGSKRSLPVISNKANDNHGHRFKRNGYSLTQGKQALKSTTLQQDGESKALGDRKVRSASHAEQRLSRAELKWGGDEGKATDSREKELKLTSTTFALTGDSAHNQAMVHWSGHNSSVILILTKLFDFNLGSVTESSLWRSTDYGTTYEKLNDKVGLKTILSYLYVSPNNKRKIMLLTDPEIESSLLISSDEGATYQKYRLSFYILSLLFHPKQEDWILAYSHDLKKPENPDDIINSIERGELYTAVGKMMSQQIFMHKEISVHQGAMQSSVEFGRRWQLVHERVAPNRFYWSVLGLDKEPDLIHLETTVAEGHAQYITCKLQNCTDANKGRPFPGYIDPNSLVVQDEYVFVQVTTGGRPAYYVSYRREGFAQMKLPKYTLPKDMHVISADENRVVAAVQEWNQNNTYNLYVSEARGVFFTLALESVVISREAGGNVMIDLYEVAGINGMFLANKKLEKQVKTYITYNKGRDWRLLQAPVTDARGNDISCLLPYCSLHLHLQVSDNPYASGNIASKESAPGIIVASGSIGSELSHSNVSMFITSDAGNTWRQIFQEEYSVLYLDQGGALVAIKHTPLPVRHLWLSFDEGRAWNKYSFTSVPLFVDGVLGEPGDETLIMTIFGHVSHRSEWQLVKIDFRSIFNRRCTEEEYQTWHLHNQGDPCIMGMKRIYRKLKPTARCVMGRDTSFTMTSEPCLCTQADFECDYGYERRSDGKCLPAFWFNPSSMSSSCSTGNSFLNSTGYRKVVSNNCTAGVKEIYTARKQQCPRRAPRGLHLVTSDGKLTATTGNNVTFLVFLEEGDGSRTSITLDFGDGNAVSYSNVSSIEDGIKHVYKNVGIFKVTAVGENSLGSDSAVLYLHVTCHLDRVHLSAPFVAVKNKEINLTAVLWPNQVGTVTYIWWFGNNTEPVITLEASISFTFMKEGINTVTVQVSTRNEIVQDKKTIAVHEHFRSQLLAFSSNLDEYNPDVAEWRQDVSKVVKNSLVQATGIAEEQLLVTVLPGLPTAAEFFLLPDKELTEGRAERSTAHLDQLSEILLSALNQNIVQFTLRAGVQVSVYAAHLSAAPLVDTTEGHSGSAMLMLLSVVFVGLAVFIIYKFKRKIPGINVYAQMQNEKEQEMISPVSPIDSTPNNPQRELVTSLELLDKELDTRAIGCIPSHSDRISQDIPIYVNV